MTNHFSVLISVYNQELPEYLQQALDSLINQSIIPSEIIIVKDGILTSQLNNVINSFCKKFQFVKIVENEINIGLGLSLAKGLLVCTNELVARMDSDDISKPDRFEKQLSIINLGFDVVSSWSEFFEGQQSNVIAVKKRPENHTQIAKSAKRRSPVCHASTMFRKSAVLRAGNYKHCLFYEDYYLWLRMIKSGARFYNIQDYIYSIRISNDQIGRRGGLRYLKNELITFYKFYKENLYSFYDLLINSIIRVFTRLLPIKLRKSAYLLMWKIYN